MECDNQHLKGLNLVLDSAVNVILVQTLQTEISFVMNENKQTKLQFTTLHMTGLLHEGIFHVQDLLQPAICESSPWAYVMCN